MKILVLNSGSSSVKYKLIDTDNEKTLAEGGVEKIGLHDGFLKYKRADGSKAILELGQTDHKGSIEAILRILTDDVEGCIKSYDEIDAVGHRVVHGGEKFAQSVLITDEVMAAMECSNPYFDNAQVVIVPADVADKYQTVESVQDLAFAVESGSFGKAEVEKLGANFNEVVDQATALLEVKSGTSDAAVIDSLMAGAMVGEGTSYADLTYTVTLNAEEGEQYGVGFRKGSNLAAALNEFFAASYADGTMMEIAETYGIQAAIVEQ